MAASAAAAATLALGSTAAPLGGVLPRTSPVTASACDVNLLLEALSTLEVALHLLTHRLCLGAVSQLRQHLQDVLQTTAILLVGLFQIVLLLCQAALGDEVLTVLQLLFRALRRSSRVSLCRSAALGLAGPALGDAVVTTPSGATPSSTTAGAAARAALRGVQVASFPIPSTIALCSVTTAAGAMVVIATGPGVAVQAFLQPLCLFEIAVHAQPELRGADIALRQLRQDVQEHLQATAVFLVGLLLRPALLQGLLCLLDESLPALDLALEAAVDALALGLLSVL
mmetsp:Transcript_16738/g.37738  ORF Transcript_16738/g.37738 Transcript_16738/m.37738 type:complete len:284 (+) Transcript_16738:484-1335(+)